MQHYLGLESLSSTSCAICTALSSCTYRSTFTGILNAETVSVYRYARVLVTDKVYVFPTNTDSTCGEESHARILHVLCVYVFACIEGSAHITCVIAQLYDNEAEEETAGMNNCYWLNRRLQREGRYEQCQ
jgi:hypothetical protein